MPNPAKILVESKRERPVLVWSTSRGGLYLYIGLTSWTKICNYIIAITL